MISAMENLLPETMQARLCNEGANFIVLEKDVLWIPDLIEATALPDQERPLWFMAKGLKYVLRTPPIEPGR